MQKNKVEILAPAGSFSALKAAVNSGADAVYLGIGEFNARVKADNFTLDNIADAITFAHLYDVKVFAAFNTTIKQNELSKVVATIKKCAQLNVDAFIVQDLGLVEELKNQNVNVVLHASTQLGIHNLQGAIVAQKLGFKRVILSREASLNDIIDIKKHTNLEVEVFVHGALCVAFSGNCYYSSMLTSNSGNRGRCLQFCRKRFSLQSNGVEKNNGFLLSTKDLYYADKLDKLVDAGVDSFKIEGRLRRDEYVSCAVKSYVKALNYPLDKIDKQNLNIAFNRGDGCTCHTFENTANLIYPYNATNIGAKVGKVKSVTKNKSISINYFCAYKLGVGDGVKFVRDNVEVGSSKITNKDKITFVGDVRAGDDIAVTTSKVLHDEMSAIQKTISITAEAKFKIGQYASLKLKYGDVNYTEYSTQKVDLSQNAPLEYDKVCSNLRKIDSKTHTMSDIVLEIDENCYLPVSLIKQMRRAAMDRLIKLIIDSYNKKLSECIVSNSHLKGDNSFYGKVDFKNIDNNSIITRVDCIGNVTEYVLKNSDYIIYSPRIYSLDNIKVFSNLTREKAILSLPNILRGGDCDVIEDIVANSGVNAFVINNISGFEFCKAKQIIIGAKMNVLNGGIKTNSKIASFESERVWENCINYIYGFVPLMTLTHCIKKSLLNGGKCEKNCNGHENLKLIDEKECEFALRYYKIKYCYSELLNSLPLDNREHIRNRNASYLIDLTSVKNVDYVLKDILSHSHSQEPHTHGNYGKTLL